MKTGSGYHTSVVNNTLSMEVLKTFNFPHFWSDIDQFKKKRLHKIWKQFCQNFNLLNCNPSLGKNFYEKLISAAKYQTVQNAQTEFNYIYPVKEMLSHPFLGSQIK